MVDGLEMPLAKEYFEDLLFLSENKIAVFLEREKIQITANTRRAFQLLETVLFSASGQIYFD